MVKLRLFLKKCLVEFSPVRNNIKYYFLSVLLENLWKLYYHILAQQNHKVMIIAKYNCSAGVVVVVVALLLLLLLRCFSFVSKGGASSSLADDLSHNFS